VSYRVGVVGEVDRARDREAEVGDGPSAPATGLVLEDAEAAEEAGTDSASFDDASIARGCWYGGHLDRVRAFGGMGDQRRVVEVASRASLDEGGIAS